MVFAVLPKVSGNIPGGHVIHPLHLLAMAKINILIDMDVAQQTAYKNNKHKYVNLNLYLAVKDSTVIHSLEIIINSLEIILFSKNPPILRVFNISQDLK